MSYTFDRMNFEGANIRNVDLKDASTKMPEGFMPNSQDSENCTGRADD